MEKTCRTKAEEEAERSTRWPSEIPKTWWPNYIYTDMGKGMVGGTIGGAAFYFTKGLVMHYERPGRYRFVKGISRGARANCLIEEIRCAKVNGFVKGIRAARANALRVGGGTTVLFGLNTLLHHYLYYYRQKDDLLNTGVAAGVVGAAALRASRACSIPASCAALCLGAFGSLLHTFYHQYWYDVDKGSR